MNTIEREDPGAAVAERIVSVNDYGPRRRSWLPRLGIAAAVVVIAIVATLHTAGRLFSQRRAEHTLNAEQARQARQAQTPSGRRTFPERAPARPAVPEVEAGDRCADGAPPATMLARDGTPMLTPGGLPVRLCRNGQVLMPPLPVPAAAAAQLVAGPAAPATPAATHHPAADGAPRDSRYDGDLVLTAATPIDSNAAAAGIAPGPDAPAAAADRSADPHGPLSALLRASQAKAVQARLPGDRDLVLPRGRSIDCNLSLRLVSEISGDAVCVLSSYVYGDSGVVVLAEPGSVATGSYVALAAPGQRRVFITWEQLRTTKGVTVDIASPAADALGASGLDGYLDNRWADRIGAAVLLSSVQDVVGYETARAGSGNGGGATGIAIFPQTTRAGRDMAERILDSTINIKPTLYKHQGDRATISVVRDLDFGSVYELRGQ